MTWVDFPGLETARGIVQLRSLFALPEGDGPFPAMVAMHGCAGLFTSTGVLDARFRAWADLLRGLGYAVLLVDSFGPRGVREECTLSPQPVTSPRERPAVA